MSSTNGRSKRGKVKRWGVNQKRRVVLRLHRGESIEKVAREESVAMHRLENWRKDFLAVGEENLKSRRGDPVERELKEAQAKIGELMMKLELLEGKDRLLRRGRRSRG